MILLLFLFSSVRCPFFQFEGSFMGAHEGRYTCSGFFALSGAATNSMKDPDVRNCSFEIDQNELCAGHSDASCQIRDIREEWECGIDKNKFCDGLSECLTDECNCTRGDDVFKCADGVGCITVNNLCDGYKDCRDGSDECMCEDIVTCQINKTKYCVPREKYCVGKMVLYKNCELLHEVNCTGVEADQHYVGDSQDNPMIQCWDDFFNAMERNNTPLAVVYSYQYFEHWCKENCNSLYKHFCHLVNIHGMHTKFINCDSDMPVFVKNICDGKVDCNDAADEKQCPGRYYCNNTFTSENKTSKWIDSSLVCNAYKDCPGGDDECQNCADGDLSVASDNRMIQNIYIQILIIVECLLIILLNIMAIWDIYKEDAGSQSARVDKLILLSICFYDTLMGVYLAYISIKSIIFSSQYCINDYEWRSGLQCKLLGLLFTFSAHGSLFMVSLTSLTRCYKCVFNRSVSFKKIIFLLSMFHLINVMHSAMPILPISSIQDVFRARMTFSKNPFMKGYEAHELVRKYKVYFGENSTVPSTYTMLKHLNNVSSGGEMFKPQELGYYSYSSICIQNIYNTQESLLEYKIIYIISIVILLIVVSVSYVSIIIHAHRIKRNVYQLAVKAAQKSNTDLSVKVMLMIGSQLICWITVMILTIVYSALNNTYASQLLYEITAVVLFPMNSYLNPIFNSFLYKTILGKFKKFKDWRI